MLLGVGYESRVPLDPPELLAEAGLFIWYEDGTPETSPNLQYFFGPVQFLAPEYMTEWPGLHVRADSRPAAESGDGEPRVQPTRRRSRTSIRSI